MVCPSLEEEAVRTGAEDRERSPRQRYHQLIEGGNEVAVVVFQLTCVVVEVSRVVCNGES